jgi:2-C-methyl-D-erythritol 4-phosphate cytidylyltransferase
MKKFALIVAGGSGSRMRNEIPKQFIELAGKPIIMHTIQKFKDFDPEFEIVVVLSENLLKNWRNLCEKYRFEIKHNIALGGETRFNSVKNGLNAIKEDGIVFIHDAVRPLVSVQTLKNCLVSVCEKGNALPVVPVTESIRMIDGDENKAVARSNFFLVQTPQTFELKTIKSAYEQEFSDTFTDDASVFEKMGWKIELVDGNRENIKITFPEDLVIASALLTGNN